MATEAFAKSTVHAPLHALVPIIQFGPEMRFALLILMLVKATLAADGVATLRELLNNTNRSGTVLLDQGYRGEFTRIYEEVPGPKDGAAEFTHALFNDRSIASRSAPAPTIAIGLSPKQENAHEGLRLRAFATYRQTIPYFEELMNMRKITDFEGVFGPFRGMADGWGFAGEEHSSLHWLAFTLASEGSIRVVSVFLHTVKKGSGWEIEKRDISEGVFRPTGHPPRMETEKAEPDGAANAAQPHR